MASANTNSLSSNQSRINTAPRPGFSSYLTGSRQGTASRTRLGWTDRDTKCVLIWMEEKEIFKRGWMQGQMLSNTMVLVEWYFKEFSLFWNLISILNYCIQKLHKINAGTRASTDAFVRHTFVHVCHLHCVYFDERFCNQQVQHFFSIAI